MPLRASSQMHPAPSSSMSAFQADSPSQKTPFGIKWPLRGRKQLTTKSASLHDIQRLKRTSCIHHTPNKIFRYTQFSPSQHSAVEKEPSVITTRPTRFSPSSPEEGIFCEAFSIAARLCLRAYGLGGVARTEASLRGRAAPPNPYIPDEGRPPQCFPSTTQLCFPSITHPNNALLHQHNTTN